MNDFEKLFAPLGEEELSELLSEIDVDESSKELSKIRTDAFKKAGLSLPQAKIKPFKRILALAACLCFVIVGTAVGINTAKPKPEPITQDPPQKVSYENPIMLAISKGDEGLVERLLSYNVFLNSDVLKFAVDSVSLLSYKIVGELAEAVYSAFGTTGLDPLLEGALIGDSQKVIGELQKSERILMTPTEKLAMFFSAAFCNSEVLKIFGEKGADLNSVDQKGNTILQIAEKNGNSENVTFAKNHNIY